MAAYDAIADWYEREFLGRRDDADPTGAGRALHDLLGPGSGACPEIGCRTGVHAVAVRDLGRIRVGADLSAGMLRHARGRLPVRSGTVDAAIAMTVHTDTHRAPVPDAVRRGPRSRSSRWHRDLVARKWTFTGRPWTNPFAGVAG